MSLYNTILIKNSFAFCMKQKFEEFDILSVRNYSSLLPYYDVLPDNDLKKIKKGFQLI